MWNALNRTMLELTRLAQSKIRGTPYNTGDALSLAESVGARLTGDFAGCHSTTWDANARLEAGDLEMTNAYTKSGYPLGIMVNVLGERFVDEGEDFRNYTLVRAARLPCHGACRLTAMH